MTFTDTGQFLNAQVLLARRGALLDSRIHPLAIGGIPNSILISGTHLLCQMFNLILKRVTIGNHHFQINRLYIPYRVYRLILKGNTAILKATYHVQQCFNVLNIPEQPGAMSISLRASLKPGDINNFQRGRDYLLRPVNFGKPVKALVSHIDYRLVHLGTVITGYPGSRDSVKNNRLPGRG